MTDIPLLEGAKSLADYVKLARPHVANLLSRGGSLLGGPVGAAGMAIPETFGAVRDSNYPGVAENRARNGAQMRNTQRGGFSGNLTPQQRIDEDFNSFGGLGPNAHIADRFADLVKQRQQPPAPPQQGASSFDEAGFMPRAAAPRAPVPGLDEQMADYAMKQRGGGAAPQPQQQTQPPPGLLANFPNTPLGQFGQQLGTGIFDKFGGDGGASMGGPRVGPFSMG